MDAMLILAECGAGKTSLLNCILKKTYWEQGYELLQNSRNFITEKLNANRKVPFELPDEPPIYTDMTSFKVKFCTGYEQYYEPYGINPFYMGLGRGKDKTQYVLPYGQIFIPEIQKYGDSRNGTTFPRALSRLFEIRRHFHLSFYMDGHRGNFIDLKIRAMCNCVIDLERQEHERDGMGRIIKTRWYCREFKNIDAYDAYYAGKDADYKETVYENTGNVFEDYDSFGCKNEFVPPDGVQFSTLKPKSAEEIKNLPPEIAQFYDPNEPKWFRKKES